MAVELPNNFKLPIMLPSYVGIGDPTIHITKFKSVMLLNSAADPFLCQSFLTFLEGSILLWFTNLPKVHP